MTGNQIFNSRRAQPDTATKVGRRCRAAVRLAHQPDDPRFLSPDDMPEKIAEFCRETGQPVPANHAAFMRCIYESLALLIVELTLVSCA